MSSRIVDDTNSRPLSRPSTDPNEKARPDPDVVMPLDSVLYNDIHLCAGGPFESPAPKLMMRPLPNAPTL